MTQSQTAVDPAAVPPIILTVAQDPDIREMYSRILESSGMWVATASTPSDAVGSIPELRPDAVVSETEFDGEPTGFELVAAIKQDPATSHVAVLLVAGRPSESPRQGEASPDAFLLRPIWPADLVSQVGRLLERSRELRAKSGPHLRRAAELMQRSDATMARAHELQANAKHLVRLCPSCSQALRWIETGRIQLVEYDYYHWCDRGCGLYCYDRAAQKWVKLAG